MTWNNKQNQLCATFKFKDFSTAFTFMTEVAMLSEKLNHHPNWSNSYNHVSFALSTHDESDIITEKDRILASKIDDIVSKYKLL